MTGLFFFFFTPGLLDSLHASCHELTGDGLQQFRLLSIGFHEVCFSGWSRLVIQLNLSTFLFSFLLFFRGGWRLLIYFSLHWVFVAVPELALAAMSGSYPLLSWCAGPRLKGFIVLAPRLTCSVACGIFPGHRLNPSPCIGRCILNHWTTREVLPSFS